MGTVPAPAVLALAVPAPVGIAARWHPAGRTGRAPGRRVRPADGMQGLEDSCRLLGGLVTSLACHVELEDDLGGQEASSLALPWAPVT